MSAGGRYRWLQRGRRLSQVSALALLAGAAALNLAGIHWVVGTFYAISFGPLELADPAQLLQSVVLNRTFYLPLLAAAAVPAALALAFGRVFCSWACPYNTLLDWSDALQRRLARGRWLRAARRSAGRPKRWIPGVALAAVLAFTGATGLPLLSFLSAPGILSAQLTQAVLGLGVGLELALVAILLAGEAALLRRSWCKYLCPVGNTLGLLRTRRTLRVACDESRCRCPAGAEACHVACPLGLDPRTGEIHPYCHNCGACLAACEKTKRSALQLTFVPLRHGRTPAAALAAHPSMAGSEQD